MALRTSVMGCVAMLGVVAVLGGCAGRVPGQAPGVDLRGLTPGTAKRLLTAVDPRAMADLKAYAVRPDAPMSALATAATAAAAGQPAEGQVPGLPIAEAGGGGAAPALTDAVLPVVTPPGPVAAEAEATNAPGVNLETAVAAAADPDDDLPKGIAPVAVPLTATPAAESAPTDAEAPAPDDAAHGLVASGDSPTAESAAPLVGFMIPQLADLAAALTPAGPRVLFEDGFQDGLAAWVSRGLKPAGADAQPAGDVVALATGRARRSLWIKTRTEIDLADSAEPRLRVDFAGEPAAIKAVWETDNGAYPEEIMLARVVPDDASPEAPIEFDLSALKQRPGHLVLVARSPKQGVSAPLLDGVRIYDAESAEAVEVASR